MNPNDSLNLKAWKVEVTTPPDFQSEVWQRIAARASERRNVFADLLETLNSLLARPAWATAVVAIGIGFGLGIGQLTATSARSDAYRELQARYTESINPLASSADLLK